MIFTYNSKDIKIFICIAIKFTKNKQNVEEHRFTTLTPTRWLKRMQHTRLPPLSNLSTRAWQKTGQTLTQCRVLRKIIGIFRIQIESKHPASIVVLIWSIQPIGPNFGMIQYRFKRRNQREQVSADRDLDADTWLRCRSRY